MIMLDSTCTVITVQEKNKILKPQLLGDNIRIDAYCKLVGNVIIWNNVHIGSHCSINAGNASVVIKDFCGLSSNVHIFTATDDYSEGFMTNPLIPDKYKKVFVKDVVLEKHVIVGCGSVIMPGSVLQEGVSVGALSFVNKTVPEYTIVSGNPLRVIGKRNKEKLQELELEFLKEQSENLTTNH